ncbi:hypothetical protein [Streptomyces sp. NPDC006274]|uniref:hypothetical protein n=1 Tax=unclassified Streptomyces TaxID=2593676 RepID=UPI0033BA7D13
MNAARNGIEVGDRHGEFAGHDGVGDPLPVIELRIAVASRADADGRPRGGGTREAQQPAQSEWFTIPAWITAPDLAGFGQLPVGAVRRVDEQLDFLFTF